MRGAGDIEINSSTRRANNAGSTEAKDLPLKFLQARSLCTRLRVWPSGQRELEAD